MEYDAKTVGKRIAKLRNQHHMTQDVLAEKLEMTGKHLSRVERGVFSLTHKNILRLSEIFSVSVDFLYTGRLDMPVNYLLCQILEDATEVEKELLFDLLFAFAKHVKKI